MARFFESIPWMNNVQNAVDSVVQDIARAADDVAENFRSNMERSQDRRQPPEQRQEEQARQQPPPFPFNFPQAAPPAANPQRIPPASARAIRQLPTIAVAPEDLVDENNRECCICIEENSLGDKVTRLPCAHIFHSECIVDWLRNHHCTCPVCRYELATDDPMYEAGRAARMKARKPRFARYELERMSVRELVALNQGHAMGIGEKKDLIQYLIDSGRIDLIPAPEPVEFKLDDLRAMKVSQLKKAMAEAGVFFRATDVVEKSDMISIFVNSGRLNLIPSENAEAGDDENATVHSDPSADVAGGDSDSISGRSPFPSRGPLVETVDECSDSEGEKSSANGEESATPVVMFPSVTRPISVRSEPQSHESSLSQLLRRESSASPVTVMHEEPGLASTSVHDNEMQPVEAPVYQQGLQGQMNSSMQSSPINAGSGTLPVESLEGSTDASPMASQVGYCPPSDMSVDEEESPQQLDELSRPSRENEGEFPPFNSQSSPEQEQEQMRSTGVGFEATSAVSTRQTSLEEQSSMDATTYAANLQPAPEAQGESTTTHSQVADCPLSEYTVVQLQRLGREANIDLSSCFERTEMVNLLVSAGVTGSARVDLRPSDFANWSISQLRAIASELNIDLSACSDRTETINRILHEANSERPHLRNYLRVLSPLTTSSLPQLRATARDWDVDISDCLEKDEIIQRLITRANQFGIC